MQSRTLYRRAIRIGGGGYRCFCCGPQGGKNKRPTDRINRRRFNRILDKMERDEKE